MPRTIDVPSTREAVAAAPLDARGAERRNGVVSPDGRWIACEDAAPSRQPDVWVRPLSGPGDRTLVSAGGGDQPRFT